MITASLELNCELANLALLRDWFRSNAEKLIHDKDLFERLNLALNELISNVVIHANQANPEKKITICLHITEEIVNIEITHTGIAFNPSCHDLPDIESLPEGGFGLFLINSAFDKVKHSSNTDGTQTIRLARKL